MITRKEYLKNSRELFQEYHLQFATKQARNLVLGAIGHETILSSKDEHFNDIPLRRWDALNEIVRDSINQKLKGQAEGYEPGRFGWSISDAVCIAKAIAQEYKESNA